MKEKTKIFVDMDGVLVNFQSGIDKLDEATKRKASIHCAHHIKVRIMPYQFLLEPETGK